MSLIHEKETYALLGACFEVYKEKGCGFLEPAYQECMEMELTLQSIPFLAQPPLKLSYKGRSLKQTYQPDLLCFKKVVVELKAVKKLAGKHRAQVHKYLQATSLRVGILVNFAHYPKVEHERIVL